MKRKIYKVLSDAKQGLFAFVLTVFLGTAYSQTTYTFNFTGSVQPFIFQGGSYRLQVWGADGGNNLAPYTGGKGGYSTGTVNAVPGTYYIYVGGKGTTLAAASTAATGGFNGGGDSGAYASVGNACGSGGGATHIASASGLLSTLSSNQTAVVIVAGGGGGGGANHGGSNVQDLGANAGGLIGGNGMTGMYGGFGGTQIAGGNNSIVPLYSGTMAEGGSFGKGGSANLAPTGFAAYPNNTGGGGGAGWYGGAAALWEGAGGGSGYIGGVTNGTTVANGQPGFIPNPDITGNGYVIITRLCAVTATMSKNPMCFGESISLSTDAVTGIVWSHTSSTSNTVNVSPIATQNYTVTGQAASGCTTSIVMTVTVNPLPSLSAAVQPSVLCIGSVATVSAFGANSYTWSATNATGNTTTVNPIVTSAFTFSGTNQYNCVNSTLVSVVVNTNVLGATPNAAICKGSSINLTATGAQSYTWSNGPMFATTPVSPTVSTTYTVLGRDIHNCVLSKIVSVTVNDLPLVVATANKTLVCKGDNVVITGSGADTYTWSTGFVGASLSTTLPVDIPYYFSVTGADLLGCKKTVNITIQVAKCLGINEMNNSEVLINVYPNPGAGLFNVQVEKVTDHLNMKVYNQLGMLVKTQDIVSTESKLDLHNVTNGLYFVQISDKDNVLKVIKLVKE